MPEPAWKMPFDADPEVQDDEEQIMLQRWVEGPDGEMELLEIPLTPELFLDPQLEDKMTQGEWHFDVMAELKELVGDHLLGEPGVKVFADLKHIFVKGFGPSPDVSVIYGVRDSERKRDSFDVREEGVVPSLIIEVVSPKDKRIRETDKVTKVKLYAKFGVAEYFLVELPNRETHFLFDLRCLRLGPGRRYREIKPNRQGRFLSETTQLLFGLSPAGDRIEVFDARTGKQLVKASKALGAAEAARREAEVKAAWEAEARKAAEAKAAQEAEAREAAEEELARLRAEVERLKQSGR